MTTKSFVTTREALARRFVLAERDVKIGARRVRLVLPHDLDALIDEEDFVRDERLPYWADLWPSAIVLAGAVSMERGTGRRLLELGCGLGLVTIAAIHAGYAALATDYYEDALRFALVNATAATGSAPAARHVDWRAMPDDLGRFDRVVAADVLYEKEYAHLVAAALARTLAPDGMATIADPGRAAAAEFVRQCESRRLVVTRRSPISFREGKIRQRIQLYDLRHA